ncbi:acetylornithine transaminase [Brevibacterium ravenspurgense]|uniref:acetylornithine transaminase n=1 Tax=Brevibacterium ravenspurgense TaxID=479117 RepID=UPI0002ED93D5|nr:acetylornithine transaminase [Brevibacterium ravenspurgense]
MTEWLDAYRGSLLPVYGDPQKKLAKGKGAVVEDSDGKRYVDFLGGIAVNSLGHAHPAIVEAVSKQTAELGQISNFYTSDQQIRLAQRVLSTAQAPAGSKVFLCNSGSEANEAAVKLARRAKPGRTGIIAVDGAFHGRTMGALSLTAKKDYREPFAPLVPGAQHVPFGDVQALKDAADENTSAIIIEPIQGEAGVRPQPAGYLAAAREIADEVGALLIFDEVQTGVGRTGSWYAFQHPDIGEGVRPDAMTLAKGLGGGLPIGALVTFGEETSKVLTAGQHGTTFGGNPIACAAANAVLDVIESDAVLEHVREAGQLLRDGLEAIPGVNDVRGAGLLLSFDIAPVSAKDFTAAALKAGFLVNAVAPTRIRLAPPLIISSDEIRAFLSAVPDILKEGGQSA